MTGSMKDSLRLEAVLDSLEIISGMLDSLLRQAACPDDSRRAVLTSADEILSNIVSYAYPSSYVKESSQESRFVEVACTVTGKTATVEFRDAGVPFNPLEHADADPADFTENGGLGIFLTTALMDTVDYSFIDGQNVLTVTKSW